MNYKRLCIILLFSIIIPLNLSCSILEPTPPVVNKFTIELPNQIKVQVEEIINESDDRLHQYNFVHSDKQIATSTQFNSPMKIETGHSGDTSFFLQRGKMICIYHDSKWVTWWIGSGESFNELWECYEKYSNENWQKSSRWDSFSIDSFMVDGNKWTIRLLTRISDGDWSGGFFPKYMFVESTDFGTSWSVQDNCKFTLRECRALLKANASGDKTATDREQIDIYSLERQIDYHKEQIVNDQIKQLTDKSQFRGYAAAKLGNMKNPIAVETLISTLSDDKPNVRASAIEALGRIGDKRATAPLLQILENQQDNKYARSYAAKALGGIKDSSAVQPLIASLSDNALEVRCASAEALGEIGDHRAIAPLVIKSLQRFREEWPVRRCAVEGLGHFRDQQSINALKSILNAFFENREVQTAARTSLEKILKTEKGH